jgi:hypothetical protein
MMFGRHGVILLAAILLGNSAVAAGRPVTLVCKGVRQTSCTSLSCQLQDVATQNELSIGPSPSSMSFCYGSACWKQAWAKQDRLDPHQVSIAYGGAAVINRQTLRLQFAAVIDTSTFKYSLAIPGGNQGTELFSGDCVCSSARAANRACVVMLK